MVTLIGTSSLLQNSIHDYTGIYCLLKRYNKLSLAQVGRSTVLGTAWKILESKCIGVGGEAGIILGPPNVSLYAAGCTNQ